MVLFIEHLRNLSKLNSVANSKTLYMDDAKRVLMNNGKHITKYWTIMIYLRLKKCTIFFITTKNIFD